MKRSKLVLLLTAKERNMQEELRYQIALTQLSKIGDIINLSLTSYRLYELLQDDRLWKRFYEKEYNVCRLIDISYRNKYKKCLSIKRLIGKLNLPISLIDTINAIQLPRF